MDNSHLHSRRRSTLQPFDSHECIFDDVDGMLYDSIFGILKRAIKKWERQENSDPSNKSKDHIDTRCRESKPQNRKQQNVNKVDNIKSTLGEGRKPRSAGNKNDDHTQAEGDFTSEAVQYMEDCDKDSQKTLQDESLENRISAHLGSDGDFGDLSKTQEETKACLQEEQCPENMRELKLSIFLNKSDFNTPVILHIHDKSSLSQRSEIEGDITSQSPLSHTTNENFNDRKTETVVDKTVSTITEQNVKISGEIFQQTPPRNVPEDGNQLQNDMTPLLLKTLNAGEIESQEPHPSTANDEFVDGRTNVGEIMTRISDQKLTMSEISRSFSSEMKSRSPHSPTTNAKTDDKKTGIDNMVLKPSEQNLTMSDEMLPIFSSEMKSQPPHLQTMQEIFDGKNTDVFETMTRVSQQRLAMYDETLPAFQTEMNSQTVHSHTTNKKTEKSETDVGIKMTALSEQDVTMSDKMLPPISSMNSPDDIGNQSHYTVDKSFLPSKLFHGGKMKLLPPHAYSMNPKSDGKKRDLGKRRISEQKSAIFNKTLPAFSAEMKAKPPLPLTRKEKFGNGKAGLCKNMTRVSGQKEAISDKTLPPIPSGDVLDGGNQCVPTCKIDFDKKEGTFNETLQEIEDDLEESLFQEDSTTTMVPACSFSSQSVHETKPNYSSEAVDIFIHTSQIRYDAIKVLAEIQMDNLKESYQDWQRKFFNGIRSL